MKRECQEDSILCYLGGLDAIDLGYPFRAALRLSANQKLLYQISEYKEKFSSQSEPSPCDYNQAVVSNRVTLYNFSSNAVSCLDFTIRYSWLTDITAFG